MRGDTGGGVAITGKDSREGPKSWEEGTPRMGSGRGLPRASIDGCNITH